MTTQLDMTGIEAFMKEAHGAQTRSGGKPYWTHPISVRDRLLRHGITDPIALATALLHDVLEDTNKTYEDILAIAGKEVADAVQQLTNKQPPKTKFEIK